MARGWDSKSVEAQIEESTTNSTSSSPGSSKPTPEEIAAKRKRADLLLSRKRVVQQLEHSSSERYSELLRKTLADLDMQIADASAGT